jgi:formate dehydrogenase maturation protein FdhE
MTLKLNFNSDSSTNTNRYHLGSRSILELDEVLRQISSDEDHDHDETVRFSECSLCFGLILIGSKSSCLNQACTQSFHKFCLSTYQETMQKKECPGCKTSLQILSSDSALHVDSLVDD